MPRTKTSNTPLVGEVAAGDEVKAPPRIASRTTSRSTFFDTARRSCLRTNRPRRLPHEQAAGPVPEAIWPPREAQLDQEPPPFVVVFCQMAPSVPRAKTSITPASSLTSQRVTRSGTRRGIASRTTSYRYTIYATGRRRCLVQRRRDDLRPMNRPLVLCRKRSGRRERSKRTRAPPFVLVFSRGAVLPRDKDVDHTASR